MIFTIYGLDWDSGAVKFKYQLGSSYKKLFNSFDDGSNNNIIDDEENIYFFGGGSFIKLEKHNR